MVVLTDKQARKDTMNPLELSHKIHEVLTSPEQQEIMCRQKLEDLNGGFKRTYIPNFIQMISKAETVGDIVVAYQKLVSSQVCHGDIGENGWAKINSAKTCKVKLSEIPAVG